MMRHRLNFSEFAGIYHSAADSIIHSKNFIAMDSYIQHGNISCMKHCMAVAHYSLAAVCVLGVRCDKESLVRGALLHDYFLYDWHEKDRSHALHGFRHPKKALSNAVRDFALNAVERDIISRHMFPLIPVPPRYIESFIVSLVDKLCSVYEIFSANPYSRISETELAI